jgi:uncharacterized protein (DUF4415 family)
MRGEIKAAKKMPPVYDPECPPSTPEAPVVALRLKPDVLSKYKALGKGYTSIMADVLNYVADNPEILSKVRT